MRPPQSPKGIQRDDLSFLLFVAVALALAVGSALFAAYQLLAGALHAAA